MGQGATVPLQDFCRIVQGGRLGLSGNDFVAHGYPAFGAGGLNGYLSVHEFDEPAVILSAIGARCGKCFYAEGKWTSLANTQLIFPDPNRADCKFLWFQLNDERRWHRSGTGQPFIKPSDVKAHRAFLPPLPEQRRTAEVLDRAEALRAKRCGGLTQLDALTQSTFLDMFGDPATNPKGWATRPLGDAMSEVYRYPTYYDITYVEEGVPEIRGELLQEDGSIVTDKSRLRYISPQTSARFPRTVLAEGDLVMSVRGTIGKIGLVPSILAGANMTANLMRMAPDRSVLNPTFAWYFTQTAFFKGQLANACSSTTILTIKAPDLKRLAIPLPPLALQHDFSHCVAAVEKLKATHRASLAELDALFASLQHRAFRGEL